MDPEDLAKLRLLKAADEQADEWKRSAHLAYQEHIQRVLKKGRRPDEKPGDVMRELARETEKSRQWLTDVKAGKFSRNPELNPKPVDNA